MPAYVPPALRNKSQTTFTNPSSDLPLDHKSSNSSSYSLDEIKNHYFHGDPTTVTRPKSNTLHDSATTPGQLSYVLLFRAANPRWDTDKIIYAKSSLEVLPAELADSESSTETDGPTYLRNDAVMKRSDLATEPEVFSEELSTVQPECKPRASFTTPQLPPSKTQPIAIFSQTNHSRTHGLFSFIGYHRITRLQFLSPNTPELIRMLDQKWTVQNRNSGKTVAKERSQEAWRESLKHRWAVIKFEKDEDFTRHIGEPTIAKIGRSASEGRSVNDMLREMRMNANGQGQSKDVTDQAEPSVTEAVDKAVATSKTKTKGIDETVGKNNWQAFAETGARPKGKAGAVAQGVVVGESANNAESKDGWELIDLI